MTTEQKLLIACGAIIIAGLIAIAAFSLGVYVGEQGWTLPEPSLVGPGGPRRPQPGQPGPGQPLPQQPGPRPDLVGRVRSVGDSSLTLDTPAGPRLVLVNAETTVQRQGDAGLEPASLSDLRRGDHVAVFGHLNDDGRTLRARAVVILPPPR